MSDHMKHVRSAARPDARLVVRAGGCAADRPTVAGRPPRGLSESVRPGECPSGRLSDRTIARPSVRSPSGRSVAGRPLRGLSESVRPGECPFGRLLARLIDRAAVRVAGSPIGLPPERQSGRLAACPIGRPTVARGASDGVSRSGQTYRWVFGAIERSATRPLGRSVVQTDAGQSAARTPGRADERKDGLDD